MNNDLVNEISNHREERLFNASHREIDEAVKAAIEMLAPGAMSGLQGLSSADDGITHRLWDQAVQAVRTGGGLVFPQYMFSKEPIPADAEPVSFAVATNVIAGRVARAILIVNGYVSGFGPGNPAEDWSMS